MDDELNTLTASVNFSGFMGAAKKEVFLFDMGPVIGELFGGVSNNIVLFQIENIRCCGW